MIDPGHGAPGNDGNTGIRCQKEADEMLRIGGFVQDRLEHPGRLEVRSTRPGGAVTDYGERIRWADEWADLLISVHSDQRTGDSRFDDPVTGCSHSEGASGFAVLWSDEGSAPLVGERQRLADLVAARLSEAGFAAYPGADYTGLYEGDPDHPGVFVDRHPEDQRIRMLRRPTVPSIIIETHNAPDPEDVDRWQEAGTLEAFASALRTAIADYASGPD